MDEPPVVPRLQQPCFLVVCRDGPNAAESRTTHLDGHLRHVEKNWRAYITAGPIREPDGEKIVGSVFLVLADSLEQAKTLMHGDPYLTCGMYESIEYSALTNSIGLFLGGRIWKNVETLRSRAAGGPPA